MSTSRVCAIHGDELVDEPGGLTMPTLYGRTYCPSCQRKFLEVLDAQGPRDVSRDVKPDADA
jgi:hypothetical protein